MEIQQTNNVNTRYEVKKQEKTTKKEAGSKMEKDGNKKIALAVGALAAAGVAGIAVAAKKKNISGLKKAAEDAAKKAGSLADDAANAAGTLADDAVKKAGSLADDLQSIVSKNKNTIQNARERILKGMNAKGAKLKTLKDGTQAYVDKQGNILAQKVVHKNGTMEFKVFNQFGKHTMSDIATPDGKFFSLSGNLDVVKDFIEKGKDLSSLGVSSRPEEFLKNSYYSIF